MLEDVQVISSPAKLAIDKNLVLSYLKLNTNDDDAIIDTLMNSVIEATENYLQRKLVTQTVQVLYADFDLRVELPYGPHQAINSVQFVSDNNMIDTLTVDEDYVVKGLQDKTIWLSQLPYYQQLRVEFVAGYGDDFKAVPTPIHDAMLREVLNRYNNREDIITGTIVQIMPITKQLLNAYKDPWL